MTETEFSTWFEALAGCPPMLWQQRLFLEHLTNRDADNLPTSIDLPTGLGKTMVMAIWLIARAVNPALPRRLVYVVDRRAVVDQATTLAEELREMLEHLDLKKELGLKRALPISTLRGQHVDNKEWLEDPAAPAIVVGTVDMIGSRLLFEGYGTSRKMRPYHAGLLGADTLIVLDEAHLVPPFERLLETICRGDNSFGVGDYALAGIVPPFRLLSLSATGRSTAKKPFELDAADFKDELVHKRLTAKKRLSIVPISEADALHEKLADAAWEIAGNATVPVRVLVYCNSRVTAVKTRDAIAKKSGKPKEGTVPVSSELFVGERRNFDRVKAEQKLKTLGFIAGSGASNSVPAFVIATSAGEVGVDLDADHMVCDLVAWERMIQRFGRVNRRGEGDAKIVVIKQSLKPTTAEKKAIEKASAERSDKEQKTVAAFEAKIAIAEATAVPFGLLPMMDDGIDVSPGALRDLRLRAIEETNLQSWIDELRNEPWGQLLKIASAYFQNIANSLTAASTPEPLRPELTRALVDAWSMTSLKEHSGRPLVAPWLRGWETDDEAQTAVVWRKHLPQSQKPDQPLKKGRLTEFFEAAPPHSSEALEADTKDVVDWLTESAAASWNVAAKKAEATDETQLNPRNVVAFVLDMSGDYDASLTWNQLLLDSDDKKANDKKHDELVRQLRNSTLVVTSAIGGLHDGLLKSDDRSDVRTIDDGGEWLSNNEHAAKEGPAVLFRVEERPAPALPKDEKNWRCRFSMPLGGSEEDEPSKYLCVDKWRHDASTEDDRAEGALQRLDDHQQWAANHASDLAQRLGLTVNHPQYAAMLRIAARLHDEGKRSELWQRAFKAPPNGPYAKTPGPLNVALLGGYRHEFGTLAYLDQDAEFNALPDDLKELARHLIAAHHGFARPVIGINGCDDAPPSALEARATEVALRFARLQRRWGPWGLAWWESLLRAADQLASRDNEDRNREAKEAQ